jgi:hypothetical protein
MTNIPRPLISLRLGDFNPYPGLRRYWCGSSFETHNRLTRFAAYTQDCSTLESQVDPTSGFIIVPDCGKWRSANVSRQSTGLSCLVVQVLFSRQYLLDAEGRAHFRQNFFTRPVPATR